MKFWKYPALIIVLLISAISVFGQEPEEYKLPKNPEKVWQEYLTTKPPSYEFFGLTRDSKEPFRSWAIQEMLGRELAQDDLELIIRIEKLNPAKLKILWQRLEAVSGCTDWFRYAEKSYNYPGEVKELIQAKFSECSMRPNDINFDRFKDVLVGLPEKYQSKILQRFLLSVRSKEELLAFLNSRPRFYISYESYEPASLSSIHDLVIKKLVFEYQLTSEECFELFSQTKDRVIISDLADCVLRNNPTDQELTRLADRRQLFEDYGLNHHLIAQGIVVSRPIAKRKEMLKQMGLSETAIWCALTDCYR